MDALKRLKGMAENQERLFKIWKSHIQNLLAISKTGVEMNRIEDELIDYGVGPVPYREMGFYSWADYLYAIRDIFIVGHFPREDPFHPRTRLFIFLNRRHASNQLNDDVAAVAEMVFEERKGRPPKRRDGTTNHPMSREVEFCKTECILRLLRKVSNTTMPTNFGGERGRNSASAYDRSRYTWVNPAFNKPRYTWVNPNLQSEIKTEVRDQDEIERGNPVAAAMNGITCDRSRYTWINPTFEKPRYTWVNPNLPSEIKTEVRDEDEVERGNPVAAAPKDEITMKPRASAKIVSTGSISEQNPLIISSCNIDEKKVDTRKPDKVAGNQFLVDTVRHLPKSFDHSEEFKRFPDFPSQNKPKPNIENCLYQLTVSEEEIRHLKSVTLDQLQFRDFVSPELEDHQYPETVEDTPPTPSEYSYEYSSERSFASQTNIVESYLKNLHPTETNYPLQPLIKIDIVSITSPTPMKPEGHGNDTPEGHAYRVPRVQIDPGFIDEEIIIRNRHAVPRAQPEEHFRPRARRQTNYGTDLDTSDSYFELLNISFKSPKSSQPIERVKRLNFNEL